jgi:hypothetical protein
MSLNTFYKGLDGSTYLNNKLHSFDGKHAQSDGQTYRWYKDGKIHRDNGPAVISMRCDGAAITGIYWKEDRNTEYIHCTFLPDGKVILSKQFYDYQKEPGTIMKFEFEGYPYKVNPDNICRILRVGDDEKDCKLTTDNGSDEMLVFQYLEEARDIIAKHQYYLRTLQSENKVDFFEENLRCIPRNSFANYDRPAKRRLSTETD